MVTISRTVEKIIEERPFLQTALSKGLINYSALAEDIKPRVEKEMNEEVKTTAISMALRRVKEKLEKNFIRETKFEEDSDIFIKSDLFEITVKKSEETFSLIKEIYNVIDSEKDFLTITQGLNQITIISNKRNRDKILEIIEEEKTIKEINNLAAISTTLPIDAINGVGYFYILTRAFAWENIPIIEIVSTLTELNFILKENDIPKAFNLFKEVINRNSKNK